jgi:putative protease
MSSDKIRLKTTTRNKPEILAPAGNRDSFLAALAAGADAVYCGLKHFSARMAAENFTMEELADLTRLAHENKRSVYIALNTLIKPDELSDAAMLIDDLGRHVKPDALIVQDPAVFALADQTGFKGQIHLSTLANVSFPAALDVVRSLPRATRVVLPREFSIDEIKAAAQACPPGLSLEVFIHGALCYGVSGRCYWSSFLGGKSGLRGRCVQPCRRIYGQGKNRSRFFSCQDLWVDVLAKLLLEIPQISGLKIEGRKKGPHYVYYTTAAYRLLCDHPGDSSARKTALCFLDQALGRKPTHYRFLPQRVWNPIDTDSQTGSGMLVGKVQGPSSKPWLEPREALLANDLLRIGYEDQSWHRTLRITKHVPKKGKYFLNLSEKERPANDTPVFLIDRREPELADEIKKFSDQLETYPEKTISPPRFKVRLPAKTLNRHPVVNMNLDRSLAGEIPTDADTGIWLTQETDPALMSLSGRIWWWLPPVIWPDAQEGLKKTVSRAVDKGFKQFVLNAPWQTALFPPKKSLRLWAGPFCNIANELAMEALASLGFSGAIVSPELGKADYTHLPARSPLPLGLIIYGNWPLCVSRIVSDGLATETLFKSPRGEHAWVSKPDDNYWVFPDWALDLTAHADTLKNLGYCLFVHINEPLPKGVHLKKRPRKWNWDHGLK